MSDTPVTAERCGWSFRHSRAPLAESAKWVEHRPPGPDRDQAFHDFASVAVLWTPDIAVRDALLISNEMTRVEVLNGCLPRWFEVDPTAATNWLNTAPLPAEFKARSWKQPSTQ